MITLSILVPSISTRRDTFLNKSLNMLYGQLDKLSPEDQKKVEILFLIDNKTNILGEKRNKMVNIAQGEYIVFVDDDDRLSPKYIKSILDATQFKKDCIVFQAEVTRNGRRPVKCLYDIKFKEDENTPTEYHRIPNHICCIRKDIAKKVKFSKLKYGEDAEYSKRLLPKLKSQHMINEILYYYDFNTRTSETYMHREKPKPVADVIFISNALTYLDYKMAQNAINTCLANAGYPINIMIIEQNNYVYKNATTIHKPGEFNYNKFANHGMKNTKAKWAVIANNDLVFNKGWLHELLKANHPLVSPHEPFDKRQKDIINNELGTINGRHLSGWCYMIKRSLWEEIKGFDEDVQFWCSDDVVIEQVGKLGVKPMLVKKSIVRHLGSRTLNNLPNKDSLKWDSVFKFNKKYKKDKFVGNPIYQKYLKENGLAHA